MTAPLRVVLADDEPDLRLLLRRLLEDDGRFRVVAEAGDGRAALEAVEQERPDLLVLDLSMPEMDGLQVLEELARRERPVTVAVLTGFADHHTRDAALALGAAAYLEKGTAFATLADRLAGLA